MSQPRPSTRAWPAMSVAIAASKLARRLAGRSVCGSTPPSISGDPRFGRNALAASDHGVGAFAHCPAAVGFTAGGAVNSGSATRSWFGSAATAGGTEFAVPPNDTLREYVTVLFSARNGVPYVQA